MHLVRIHDLHPYNSTNTARAWKKSRIILSERSDFRMIECLPIAVHDFTKSMLTPLSVDEMFLLRYVKRYAEWRQSSEYYQSWLYPALDAIFLLHLDIYTGLAFTQTTRLSTLSSQRYCTMELQRSIQFGIVAEVARSRLKLKLIDSILWLRIYVSFS